jgi:2'-5' RNA ligase
MVIHRFFIALLPPQDVRDSITEIKQIFADRYNSRAALRSPPHITLQPPFEWLPENLITLTQSLKTFAQQQSPVPTILSGFGAFAPRVIFVDVKKTPELLSIHSELLAHMEAHLNIVDAVAKMRPFAPHVTVGFRDLTKSNFRSAWAEFQHQPLNFEFVVANLTLLVHTGKQWEIHQEFPLG